MNGLKRITCFSIVKILSENFECLKYCINRARVNSYVYLDDQNNTTVLGTTSDHGHPTLSHFRPIFDGNMFFSPYFTCISDYGDLTSDSPFSALQHQI